MKIELANFGGIIPSRDPIALPAEGAQVAKNVDLSGATLRPWSVTNAFTRLHDDDNEMVAGFDVTEIAKITQAGQVTLTKAIPMPVPFWKYVVNGGVVVPYGWLTVKAYFFFNYVDPATGDYESDSKSFWLLSTGAKHTPNGFILHTYAYSAVSYTFKTNVAYQVHGPLFKFYLTPFATRRYAGGPDAIYNLPTNVYSGSDQIPSVAVPLLYPTSFTSYDDDDDYITAAYDNSVTNEDIATYQYGTLVCTDYNGEQLTGSRMFPGVAGDETVAVSWNLGSMSFTFDCNYVRNRAERYYYVQQMIDASDRDGP